MTDNSRQALVGAIGGTFISLATMDIDELTIGNFALLNSADFASPMEAITRYLASIPRCPRMVSLSIAGHVTGETATMTHLPWSFNWNDIRAVTDADKVCFVNEFEALALAMPHMTRYELIELGNGRIVPGGTKVVVAAGTGLGTAGLSLVEGKWRARAGASGLAFLPLSRTDDFDFGDLANADGQVQAGHILTGKGLAAVYAKLLGQPTRLSPPQITAAGLSGTDKAASRALELIGGWLGRFAAEVALHAGATGGLYLAGGLPTGLVETLRAGAFRKAFEGAGERQDYLQHVAVFALKAAADPGLRGAAIALADSLPKPSRRYHSIRV